MSGHQLRQLFEQLRPFDRRLQLRPDSRLRTVLAANANFPLEVQARGFLAAAGEGAQSPLIIQLSYHALRAFGEGGANRRPAAEALADGAGLADRLLRTLIRQYGCRVVALSLDHFRVPAFPALPGEASRPRVAVARALVEDAAGFMAAAGGLEPPTREEAASYAGYLGSRQYLAFLEDFSRVVASIRPAWAMIDTEKLPPVLNCAVTREVTGMVRQVLLDREVMMEAEYGATGTAGEASSYRRLEGEPLARFAAQVAAFVQYTGADAIAYPIGMVHAAPSGESHEPDRVRLETVQRAIIKRTGRYVPFAQHGGTGAASLARGLVGKNNVNTGFLVAAANAVATYAGEHREGIRRGEKAAAGVSLYLAAVDAVRRETVRRLQEAGTWQAGQEIKFKPGGGGPDRPEPVPDPDRE
ncbi:MAG TPA: hypothetical protein DCM14_03335 [Clostridiales bacterium UBA8153]|nr:hypothetical protein [Clostridiales bacterium UBA8153]